MGDARDGVDDSGQSAHKFGLIGELGKGGMAAETSWHRAPLCGHDSGRSNGRKQGRAMATLKEICPRGEEWWQGQARIELPSAAMSVISRTVGERVSGGERCRMATV